MAQQSYDLVVIGSGPGGYIAAIRAAQLGMNVACVEKDPTLGGTCLNVGCIPSKALLESSEHYAEAKSAFAAHGVVCEGVRLELATMMKRKDKVVDGFNKGVASLFKKNGIKHIHGTARITAPGQIEVTGDDDAGEIAAKRILIATGSVPIELESLPFDGKRIVSSTEALALPEVPKRLLVVGAGAIGLELGSVWCRLGSQVVVVELTDQLAPPTDRQIARELQRALKKQGIEFRLETTANRAEVASSSVTAELSKGSDTTSEEFDVVLVAVGRRAYIEGLGLDALGVEVDKRGRIAVDTEYQTSIEGIYAIGDCIPGPMLAHKAEDEGVCCVERMNGVAGHVNYNAIPAVIYTWPELTTVGMSEDQARAEVGEVRVGTFPFRANSRARCTGDTEGMVKMVADAATDRLLGIHIVGPAASELAAEAAVAIEFGASSEDIARSVHAHPTFAEAMKEAALAVDGRTLNF